MASYSFSYSNSKFVRGLQSHMQSSIRDALEQAAEMTRSAWQEGIFRAPGIWGPVRDRYAASIKIQISADGHRARIFSDDPDAEGLETGRPPRDLKKMLDTSLKTRVVQNGKNAGKRYMIIPMRHNTPGSGAHAQSMPTSVYDAVKSAKSFDRSSVTSIGTRPNQLEARGFAGAHNQQILQVAQRTYSWGARLNTAGMGLSKQDAKRYNGMVAFRTNLRGAPQSSSYMTFRVMMEGSPGWIVGAKPGLYIVKNASVVAEKVLKQSMDNVANG